MITLENVTKSYGQLRALDGVNLSIAAGEFVVIVGASGAGKSTLLRSINGLVRPESGQVTVHGRQLDQLSPAELRQLRRQIGLIFQDFNLVERSSVITNVLIGRLGYYPVMKSLLGMFSSEDIKLAQECLERVHLSDKLYAGAGQLSGGQKQRVSIARALAQRPNIILADEPVASLDLPSAHDVMSHLATINREQGVTVVVNLHDIGLAVQYGQRLIGMSQGRIVHDSPAAEVDMDAFTRIYGRKPYRVELGEHAYAAQ